MFKVLLIFLFAVASISESTVIKFYQHSPQDEFDVENSQFLRSVDETALNLGTHAMDFLKLIDVDKMVMVAMQHMSDPEVLMFMKFVFSPQFKKLVWDFEMMEEFKEAVALLESKGYDMESVINIVNIALNLPPFENSNFVLRSGKGISGLIEALVDTLPLEEMKKLFESKLQTVPEIADLFETINSQEFMDIMKRLRENPKFKEFKTLFESYGFDFKNICGFMKEVFGDYYQGVFCE